MKNKIFEPFKIKDIVFLAILSAVTLCTCAVMPLVTSLQTVIFGIAQLVTGLQISVFFAIGLMKIPKTGALFLMSLFTGIARGVLREYSLRVYSNDLDGRVTFIKVGISDHDSMNRNLPSMATVRGERNVLLFFFSFVPLLTMVFRFGSAIPY